MTSGGTPASAPPIRTLHVVVVSLALAAVAASLIAWGGGFGTTVGGADLYAALIARHRYAAEAFRAGHMPLWNPYEFCGLPLLGTGQGSVLYLPIVLPNLVLPVLPALQVVYDVHLAALILLTFWYLGRGGTSLAAAALGAAVAGACVFNDPASITRDHPHLLAAAVWVPAMLLAWDAWLAGRQAALAAIPLCYGIQWLTGYPEFPLDTAVAFMVVAALSRGETVARRLAVAAALLAVGGLVGAVQSVPLAETVGQSVRAGQAAFPSWYRNVRTMFAFAGPADFVDRTLDRYGAAAVFCVALGLAAPERHRLAWGGALLWALFAVNRPFIWLYELYPFSNLRFAFSWHLLQPLFAGFLAAAGIDRLRRSGVPHDVLPSALAALVAALGFARGRPLVGTMGLVCAAAAWPAVRRHGGWAVPLVLFGLHAGGVLTRIATAGSLPAPDLPALAERVAALKRLRATLPAHPRVVSGPELRAGLLLADHLPSMAGYEPPGPPRRAWRLNQSLALPTLWSPQGETRPIVWQRLAASPGAAAAAGIGLAVVPGAQAPILLAAGYRVVERLPDGDVVLYRAAVPRFHLVHAATHAADETDALRRLLAPDFDPAGSVILEGAAVAVAPAPPGSERVEVVEDAAEEIRLRVQVASPALLVVADTHYPGWQAHVDGASVPILHANYAFRALALAPGVHAVELSYRPRAFAAGVVLTAIGLALTAGVWFLGRRRPAPAGPRT